MKRLVALIVLFMLCLIRGNAQDRIPLDEAYETYTFKGFGYEWDLGYIAKCPVGHSSQYYGMTHGLYFAVPISYNRWSIGFELHAMLIGTSLKRDFVYQLDTDEGVRDYLVEAGSRMQGTDMTGILRYTVFEKKRNKVQTFIGAGRHWFYPRDYDDEYEDALYAPTTGWIFEAGFQLTRRNSLFLLREDALNGSSYSVSLSVARATTPAMQNNWSLNISLLCCLGACHVQRKDVIR